MDAVRNPFTPGAGNEPPELAGRDDLRRKIETALKRIRIGRPEKSFVLVGLRGVGKTVLLNRMMRDAEAEGHSVVAVEAAEDRSLPGLLAPKLRITLLKLSRTERAGDLARRALRGLAGLVGGLKLKYNDVEVGLDYAPEPGLADNGDLESDLTDLLVAVGQAAQAGGTVVVIAMDEIQYVPTEQLGALVMGLHRCAQLSLPIALVGAGLPQLRGRLGNAKSYAERMFEFPRVGPLDRAGVERAIAVPIRSEGADIEPGAIEAIFERTQGYPYFVQEWGKHTWEEADASPVTRADVEGAAEVAVATLDESFFRVRFDRLTPKEKEYLRAMASLGPGPYRSGDVAGALGRNLQQVGQARSSLIEKGMIWSPEHGGTAFTVPLFDEFMRRIMPEGPAP